MKTKRRDYPICPWCGGRVAAAMMTSRAIRNGAMTNNHSPFYRDLYYPPDSLSIYCVSANCNYDMILNTLTTPIPEGDDENL
jgi:hypothetical protein